MGTRSDSRSCKNAGTNQDTAGLAALKSPNQAQALKRFGFSNGYYVVFSSFKTSNNIHC